MSAVTCSSRRQKSPRKKDSQIVKYKNIFSTRQKVKKNYSAPKELSCTWKSIMKYIEWTCVCVCVCSKNQQWLRSSSRNPMPVLHQTSDLNSQHCKFLSFLVIACKSSIHNLKKIHAINHHTKFRKHQSVLSMFANKQSEGHGRLGYSSWLDRRATPARKKK